MRNNLITNDEQEQASAFARLRGVLTRQCAKRFAQVEEGSLIVFALFIFVMMMLFGGIAVDVMHAETVRTTMQSTLDRAVLAAADLDQTVDGEDVVDDYFAKAGMGHLDYDVVVTETGAGPIITSRRVDAKANANIGTFFMRMSGYPYLPSPASGAAMEGVTHIEISLVLDVSGSMGNYSRLTNLKVAAKDFIDDIFENDEGDKVSVSIIPYSTQVSAGPTLLSYYNATAEHSYSHCVEFTANDFLSASLSDTDQLQRAGHFDPWTSKNDDDGAEDLVCRNESHFHIQPFSNDITALKNQITAFTANGNTSIDIGVKWGAALLDDDTQELVTEMVDDGHVIEAFDGRPLTYSNGNVLKVIVVMTDGVNTSQYYLNDDYRSGLSPIYRRPSNGRFSMASVEKNDEDNDNDYSEPYFYADAPGASYGDYWIDDPYGGSDAVRLTWPQVWEAMNVKYWAYWLHRDMYNDEDDEDDAIDAAYDRVNSTTKDTRLDLICTAAKNNFITIYSIGFEVTNDSAEVMEDCASTPNHFYRVTGQDISYAFASIANEINQLKLVE